VEALIQLRRGTAAQWLAANPILAEGEPGLEVDTHKGKYGTGSAHWIDLPYSWAYGPQGPAGGGLTGSFPNPTIATNAVGAAQIVDLSVGTNELANGSVTSAKLAPGAVNVASLGPSVVGTAALADGAVTSAKILDGTIAVADMSSTAVNSLMVDVADEGVVEVTNAGQINFSGAGVSVSAAGAGVANVIIPGGGGTGGTTIPAGTIMEWSSPTPPAGWFLCDGQVRTSLAAVLGTRYGTTGGTTPFFLRIPCDVSSSTVSDIIASNQPGWTVDAAHVEMRLGTLNVTLGIRRSGATLSLPNINHSDQALCILRPNFYPQFGVGPGVFDAARWGRVSQTGSVFLTVGVNEGATDADVPNGTTFNMQFIYPPDPTSHTFPSIYKIIKDV